MQRDLKAVMVKTRHFVMSPENKWNLAKLKVHLNAMKSDVAGREKIDVEYVTKEEVDYTILKYKPDEIL